MKFDFKKIVVPTLAIAIGAAIAGSVSGTVAWYQYSTRVSTAYLGTSTGTAGNLKLRIKDSGNDFANSLTKDDIATYLAGEHMGEKIIPITAGNMAEDDALNKIGGDGADKNLPKFYKNPVRSFDDEVPYSSDSWLKADQTMYVQIPLEVCFVDFDGVNADGTTVDEAYLEKDVYLSDLLIQEDWENSKDQNNLKKDLSSAIRVHISSYRDDDTSANHADSTINKLISKKGGTILTEGYLDLDGDGNFDSNITGSDPGAKYGFGENTATKDIVYGEGVQTSYSVDHKINDGSYLGLDGQTVNNEKVYPSVVQSVSNKSLVLDEDDMEFTKEGASVKTNKKIGTTIGYEYGEDGYKSKYLNVVITIWLEGWHTLPAPTGANPNAVSSIWDASSYIGSMFDVGIQFAVQAE